MAYVVSGTRFRAKRDFFSWINFFCQDGSNELSHARIHPHTAKSLRDDVSNAKIEATSIDRLIAMYGSRSKNTISYVYAVYSVYGPIKTFVRRRIKLPTEINQRSKIASTGKHYIGGVS